MGTHLTTMFRMFSSTRQIVDNVKKVVVITGCDSGLGFSLASSCLDQGTIVVAGCLLPDGEGARQLSTRGAHVVALDVTQEDAVANATKAVEKIMEDGGCKLQAVVNNAGVMVFGEFEWQTPRQIQQQLSVNLLGYFNIAHAFLPALRQDKGRLLNIVSHCALAGLPGLSVYGATKAAILNWNDTMRIEQRKYGVSVISFIPGSFFTESGILAKQSEHTEVMRQAMTGSKRLCFGDYFEEFQSYLSLLPRLSEIRPVSDEGLQKKLLHAVLSKKPQTHYKHEPPRYTFYHTLFKICPVILRDFLVERFAGLPKYKIH